MASRASRTNSWDEPLENIARARRLAEQFGLSEAHPKDYLDSLPMQEARVWDDLISKTE